MSELHLVVWDQSYSVADKTLDAQHQTMFAILNAVHARLLDGCSSDQIKQSLQEVMEYAEKHFSAEEAAMKAVDYPGLAAQQDAHQLYKFNVERLMDQFRVDWNESAEELLRFLKHWWKDHVVRMDTLYAPYMSKPRPSPPDRKAS